MSTNAARLDEVFAAAAAETAPAARAAYLDQACQDDPELRDRVEALLVAHEAAGSFLKLPSGEATSPFAASSERPGATIGRYKLLEQIGDGGMGTVWVAQQTEPIRRRVAIKLVKPGMDSRQVLSRFEAERQALALMDHPNIAKVFDAGMTDQGRPYFVMEYVKGVPLTDYCDQTKLTVQQRLELFIQVCQAVQHAHQKGIIHRDLKPSNILICLYDGQPVPKVIDFGLAKAIQQPLTEHTLYTAHGVMVGTPLYMSPEQAEFNNLDIDTRTDVYALGVILYELLTGSTPLDRQRFKDAAWQEIVRVIKEEEPTKPSTKVSGSASLPAIAAQRGLDSAQLSRVVRGDLDWIVMKSLEKERSRRYETANSLARDVERYLHDEPIEARPPSPGYRLRKLARRYRGAVVAAGLVAAALLAGMTLATWQAVVATRAKGIALAAAAAEAEAKEAAEEREAELQAVLGFVESKVFAAARPEGQAGGLGRDVSLRAAVESALPFVEASFTKQPLIEARLRHMLGESFLYLGEGRIAAEQAQMARNIFLKQLGPESPATLDSAHDLAICYRTVGRDAEALQLSEETLAASKAALGPEHPTTLKSMLELAVSYHDFGRHAEALQLAEEALALTQAALGPEHPETLQVMHELASCYGTLGRYDEAVKLLNEVIAAKKVTLGPEHPETFISMHNLAIYYSALGRHDEALQLREEMLAPRKAKLGPDHPDTLKGMANLANSYLELGRYDEALQLSEEMLALSKAKLGPDHPITLLSRDSLAASYNALGRHDEALQLHEEAQAISKAKFGPDHPNTIDSMDSLALSYIILDRPEESIELLRETIAVKKASLGPEHPETLKSIHNLAISYSALSRHEEALRLNEETLAIRKEKLGLDHPDTLRGMHLLAADYNALGRHEEALQLREETLARQKAKLGADHPLTLAGLDALAADYFALDRHDEALQLHEEAHAISKAKLGPDHPDTLKSMANLASSYAELGRHDEALQLREETLALLNAAHGPHVEEAVLISKDNLGNSYFHFGRHAEALQLYQETLAVRKAKLGSDHEETLASMYNVALAYGALGRHDEALKLREEMLALQQAKLGPDHEETLQTAQDLSSNYYDRGRHDEALKLRVETLALQQAKLDADDPDIRSTKIHLAHSYNALGRLADAEALLTDDFLSAIEYQPQHIYMLRFRGQLRARRGQWASAAADWQKLLELEPDDHWNHFRLAALLAQTGDVAAYRDHRARILRQFGETDDAGVAERTAKICLILPPSAGDFQALSKLADMALATEPSHPSRPYFEFAKGLLEFRQGEFAAAADRMEIVSRSDAVYLHNAHDIVLAMARLALNQPEAARAAFERGIRAGIPPLDSDDLPENWQDVLIVHALLREAVQMVEELVAQGKASLEADHPDRLQAQRDLAVVYAVVGRSAEAHRLLEEIKTALGPEHPGVFEAQRALAGAFEVVANLQEAEALLTDDLLAALAKQPPYTEALRQRGQFRARLGRWESAAADMRKLVELEPDHHWNYCLLASLLAQTGDVDAYRDHCGRMLERFGDADDPWIAERMIKWFLILPAPESDLQSFSDLADVALDVEPSHGGLSFFRFAKGLVEFRQGNFAAAAQWMERVLNAPAYHFRNAEALMVLAMARQGLNEPEAARAAFQRGNEYIRTHIPQLDAADVGPVWYDAIIVHALQREAEAMLGLDAP